MPFNLPLKEMYKAKDLAGLEKLMPREIAKLREEEKNLRPLLEKWGYRDLLWWS
jgi:ATP phosphoribosyltransferase regulatory subunit HisZ